MRDPRDCFLLGVCALEKTFHSRTRVLPRRRIQRERSNNKAKKSYINNTFAHTLALLAVREVTLRRKKNGVRPLSKSFSLGCSGLDTIGFSFHLFTTLNIQRFHVLRLSQRERD